MQSYDFFSTLTSKYKDFKLTRTKHILRMLFSSKIKSKRNRINRKITTFAAITNNYYQP